MSDQPTVDTKKEYEKPAVIYRQAIEAVAAVCDPLDPINAKEEANTCSAISS